MKRRYNGDSLKYFSNSFMDGYKGGHMAGKLNGLQLAIDIMDSAMKDEDVLADGMQAKGALRWLKDHVEKLKDELGIAGDKNEKWKI